METIKPRKSLTEETYDRLLDAICYGELPPGHRINQDKVAERLSVSRQPVNNAISLLKADKLVEDTGRRGVVVSELDRGFFESIYEFRRVIEPFAVRLASQRSGDDARQDARNVLGRGDAAIQSGDIRALVEADMEFHQLIYRWSNNAAIVASMQVNWHHIRRAMVEVLQKPSSRADSWSEHAQIIVAIFDRDEKRASELMERHIIRAYSELIAKLG
ncbi:GntR family transcriptional regulator [Tropicimonas sediminicola]|uniref:Transcriptional regulator, GntR family n=1 Tax=Tropicimonas sediminicola TaxID=1031541 RepID=A0A239H107_9RHOB|nr:GntR family transcriptional regulator [Tropicimonas sediminicola]SNS75067.1 transcriptional regulator, GntR family [Tropicimonas sediminicola]